MTAVAMPAIVDYSPWRSAVRGEGDNEHLLAVLTSSQAYGTWRVNAVDYSVDRSDWFQTRENSAHYPASASRLGVSRDEAVALALGWVTGELTREDLTTRTRP
jgi:hypothetical protein